jgi:tetratricopeptide (TPR) repeat protein
MKRLKLTLGLLIIMIVLQSSAWVKLTLVKPALVPLPLHIKKIVAVDYAVPTQSTQSIIEEVLTGELLQQDVQAVDQLIEGSIYLCNNYQRYEIIRSGERIAGGGTKSTFPSPLSWAKVEAQCRKHGADALMAIEIFDSDFIVTNNPVEIETKDENGNVIKSTQYKAQGIAIVNVGIRLYDPVERKIVDQYRITEKSNFDAQGNTIELAINGLLDKTEAIKKTGYNTGIAYGKRISPWYYKVTRYFFNKPKKSKYLQEGVRKSEVADWEGAIESWQKVFTSKNKKDIKAVGKAAFNIAVAYEVLGDLEKAKEWASKSYTEYGEKDGNDYYKKLQYRINEENILRAQLGEE